MTATATLVDRPAPISRVVARHSGVVGAQVLAGVGNLAFAIAAVHLLAPSGYSHLAAFLAAYLLINTPAASLPTLVRPNTRRSRSPTTAAPSPSAAPPPTSARPAPPASSRAT